MDETVDVTEDGDKVPLDENLWGRDDILLRLQALAQSAPESAVRLKCLEHLLEALPAEPEKGAGQSLMEAARRARAKVQNGEPE